MISETLATVLRSGRAEFNARYEEARQRYPVLEGMAFARFLEENVDPLAQGVVRIARDRVADVVAAAYDVGLELVGQRLLGNEARERLIESALRQMALPLLPLIAVAPARILPALCNALYNLAVTPGARPEQWAADLGRLGVQCAEPEQLLKLGQVLAWRAGLAHFRQGALAAIGTFPEPLAIAAVGADSKANWPAIAQRLAIDPWFDPAAGRAAVAGDRPRLAVVGRVGAFRGFGGLFVDPPQVASSSEHLYVRSGDDCWLLFADSFGATLHRATVEEFEAARQNQFTPDGLRLDGPKVVWGNRSLELPAFPAVASSAATATTVAVTTPFTFAITLIAGT